MINRKLLKALQMAKERITELKAKYRSKAAANKLCHNCGQAGLNRGHSKSDLGGGSELDGLDYSEIVG